MQMQQKMSAESKLAQEMQQACVGLRAGRLQRLIGRRFDQALRPLGLSISQMEVLSALTIIGTSARPSDLAAGLGIERSTMSRNLALMEQHGLIEPTETSPTGRSTRVGITDSGREQLAGATDAWRQAQESVTKQVGEDVSATLDEWIAKLSAS